MTTAAAERVMAKGRKPKTTTPKGVQPQIAFRAPEHIKHRMEKVADQLGLDPSNFMRMMLIECLPNYEQRAGHLQSD